MDLICPKSLCKVAHNYSPCTTVLFCNGIKPLSALLSVRLVGVPESNGAIQLKKLPEGLNYIRSRGSSNATFATLAPIDLPSDLSKRSQAGQVRVFQTLQFLTGCSERKLFKYAKWLTFESF